jgi:hypothetical protein
MGDRRGSRQNDGALRYAQQGDADSEEHIGVNDSMLLGCIDTKSTVGDASGVLPPSETSRFAVRFENVRQIRQFHMVNAGLNERT